MAEINKPQTPLFDKETKLLNEQVAATASEILEIYRTADFKKIKVDEKRYIVDKNKKSLPGLEDGVDEIRGFNSRYARGDFKGGRYFEIRQGDTHYFIDKDGQYMPGLEEGFTAAQDGWIKDKKTNKYNQVDTSYVENQFILQEWADNICHHRGTGIREYINIMQFGDQQAFQAYTYSRQKLSEKFDSVEVFNNRMELKKEKKDNDEETLAELLVTKGDKYFIYNQQGNIVGPKEGIPISRGKISGFDGNTVVVRKDKKVFIYNGDKLIGPEVGADSYKGIHDVHVNNRYFLMQYGEKYQIYTHRGETAVQLLPQGFDKFIGVKDVDTHKNGYSQHKKYLFAENEGKKYMLGMNYISTTEKALGGFENGFDDIKPIYEKWYNHVFHGSTNSLLTNYNGVIPFVISNEGKYHVFDCNAEMIVGLEDGVDQVYELSGEVTRNTDIVYVKKGDKYNFVELKTQDSREDRKAFNGRENGFDEFVQEVSQTDVMVIKEGERFLYNTEKGKYTPVKGTVGEAQNTEKLNEFFATANNGEEEDGLPF